MKITVLNENTAGSRGFLAEHGLSLLIETEGKRWLFDTGQSAVFLNNAENLSEDLMNLDGIILSHGHFDHCGGMEYLVKKYKAEGIELPPVYVREGAFRHKTVKGKGFSLRDIGIPWRRQMLEASVRLTKDREEIDKGIWVLGNIPYTVEFEKKPDTFFIEEKELRIPDYMEDEQLLIIDTPKGLFAFGGCCHAGIMNSLAHIKSTFKNRHIYFMLAGMHLSNQSRERVLATVEALRETDLEILVPVHCTGVEAIGRMKVILGDRCLLAETGKIFEIES